MFCCLNSPLHQLLDIDPKIWWFSPSSMSDSSNHVTLLQISMFIYIYIYSVYIYICNSSSPWWHRCGWALVPSPPTALENRPAFTTPRRDLLGLLLDPGGTHCLHGNNVLLGCHKSGCHTMYHCTIQLNHGTIVDDRDGRSVHSECTISIHITIMSFCKTNRGAGSWLIPSSFTYCYRGLWKKPSINQPGREKDIYGWIFGYTVTVTHKHWRCWPLELWFWQTFVLYWDN